MSDKSLSKLNSFQKRLHDPEDYTSEFCFTQDKSEYAVPIIKKLKVVPSGEHTKYIVDTVHYDYLSKTIAKVKIPKLEIADNYRGRCMFRWVPNLFHNIMNKSEFQVGVLSQITLTQRILDSIMDEDMNDNNKRIYQECIGNVPELIEWNVVHPDYTLWVPQLWMFSLHKKFAFPLIFMNAEQGLVQFDYKWRLAILRLVQVTLDGKMVVPDLKYFKDISKDTSSIPLPSIKVRYENIPFTRNDHVASLDKGSREYYYHDFVEIDKVGGRSISIGTDYIASKIYWRAINNKAKKFNDRSNCTTRYDNAQEGLNPIRRQTLKNAEGNKIFRFEDREDQVYKFPDVETRNWIPGSHSFLLCSVDSGFDRKGGQAFTKDKPAMLSVEYFSKKDEREHTETKEDESDLPDDVLSRSEIKSKAKSKSNSHKYGLNVVLRVTRCIEFYKSGGKINFNIHS